MADQIASEIRQWTEDREDGCFSPYVIPAAASARFGAVAMPDALEAVAQVAARELERSLDTTTSRSKENESAHRTDRRDP